MGGTEHRLVPRSGFLFRVTLDALELQNPSGRLGGLQLLFLPAPWSARVGKGYRVGGKGLVNLATLCAPSLRSGLPAVPVTRRCVRVNGSWKSDLHKIAPELIEY